MAVTMMKVKKFRENTFQAWLNTWPTRKSPGVKRPAGSDASVMAYPSLGLNQCGALPRAAADRGGESGIYHAAARSVCPVIGTWSTASLEYRRKGNQRPAELYGARGRCSLK